MYRFNWSAWIRTWLAKRDVQPVRIAWLSVLISQLRIIHWQFQSFSDEVITRINSDGSLIYLENYLNDLYDPTARTITIENVNTWTRLYLYNRQELKPKTYLYPRFEPATPYIPNDYVNQSYKRYISVWFTTGSTPPSADWTEVTDRLYVRDRFEYFGTNDYIVHMAAVSYVETNVRAKVKQLNPVGKRYTITA